MFPHFVENMDPLARDEGAENMVQDIILQGNEDDVVTSFLNESGEGAEELYRTAEGSGSDSDYSGDNRDGSGADGSGAGTTKSGKVY